MDAPAQKQIQFEKLAHKIVLDCIEAPFIDTNALVSQVIPNISRQHYEDIETERSITNLCGYPCCSKKLQPSSSSMQYRIDCGSKKVFDITNRKNFCSDWCFTASKYILEQIPETPIWTRDGKQKKTVSVYPKDRPGRPGDEIILNELAEELEQINLIDDKESAELTDKLKKPDCHVVDSRSRLREMSQRKVDFLPEAIVVNEDDEVDQESYSQDEGRDKSSPESLLNEEFCMRIAHFYSKNQSLDSPSRKEDQNLENTVVVPNIDSKNQARERREIVLRAITKSFNNFATSAILSSSKQTWNMICKLIETFNLNASNVFVDPRANDLLLIILLSILSNVDNSLISNSDKFEEFSINIYKRFGYCDLNELQNFITHFWKFSF